VVDDGDQRLAVAPRVGQVVGQVEGDLSVRGKIEST
jgi:hypothetical protein